VLPEPTEPTPDLAPDASRRQASLGDAKPSPWTPRGPTLARLDGDLAMVLRYARDVADRVGWGYTGTGHVLWSVLHDVQLGPMLSDLGLFPTRVEALLMHLPSIEHMPEFRNPNDNEYGPALQSRLEGLHQRGALDARSIATAVLSQTDSEAHRIVEHCGLDPTDVERWVGGGRLPDTLRWKPYAPSAAALIEVDAGELYEELCTHAPADMWACEPWPRRWLRLLGSRAEDIERGTHHGRLAAGRVKTLAKGDRERARTPAGRTAIRLAKLAYAHAEARDRPERAADGVDDPQSTLAVSAGRAALVLSQAQGLLNLQADCHGLLADLLRDRAHPNVAVTHARLAYELALFIGNHRAQAFAEVSFGHALTGDDSRSSSDLHGSFDVYSEHYTRAAEILRRVGDTDEADMLLAKLEEIRRRIRESQQIGSDRSPSTLGQGQASGPPSPAQSQLRPRFLSDDEVRPRSEFDRDDANDVPIRASDARLIKAPIRTAERPSAGWLARFDASGLAALYDAVQLARADKAVAVSVEHLRVASARAQEHSMDSSGSPEERLRAASRAIAESPPFRTDAKNALMAAHRASIRAGTKVSADDIAAVIGDAVDPSGWW
jgi:hypothetical protein